MTTWFLRTATKHRKLRNELPGSMSQKSMEIFQDDLFLILSYIYATEITAGGLQTFPRYSSL